MSRRRRRLICSPHRQMWATNADTPQAVENGGIIFLSTNNYVIGYADFMCVSLIPIACAMGYKYVAVFDGYFYWHKILQSKMAA